MYNEADMIVVIGEKMAEKLIDRGVDRKKIHIVHNWADPEDFEIEKDNKNAIREEFGLDKKFVVLYSGNMGVVHDFDTVKRGIFELKDYADIAFLFIGGGLKKTELQKFKREMDISNIYFLPYQPREKLKISMNAGDIILVTQDEKSAGLMVPSKIYSALASGKPVLAIGPRESELCEIVTSYPYGIFCENGDAERVVSAIKQISLEKRMEKYEDSMGAEMIPKEYLRPEATKKFFKLIVSMAEGDVYSA